MLPEEVAIHRQQLRNTCFHKGVRSPQCTYFTVVALPALLSVLFLVDESSRPLHCCESFVFPLARNYQRGSINDITSSGNFQVGNTEVMMNDYQNQLDAKAGEWEPKKKVKSDDDEAHFQQQQNQRAPLYITVGPQCSGKTTMLSNILSSAKKSVDVSIDAQKGVYYSIPLEYALIINPINMTETERALKSQNFLPFAITNQTIHGSTLQERVLHPSQYELHLVLQRLCSKISSFEFRQALTTTNNNNNDTIIPPAFAIPTGQLREELIQCVERAIINRPNNKNQKHSFVSPNIDLFVADAIFKGGGLHSALAQLEHACMNETMAMHPVAWGNTNTRPREYENALKFAGNSKRPVYFIVYGPSPGSEVLTSKHVIDVDSPSSPVIQHHGTPPSPTLLFLPVVNRINLIQRNIDRFCLTGRYINVKAINEAIIRTEDLLKKASYVAASIDTKNNNRNIESTIVVDTTFELHASLAMLAGFQMCPLTRTVSPKPRNTTTANNGSSISSRGMDRRNIGRGMNNVTMAVPGSRQPYRPAPVRSSAWGVATTTDRNGGAACNTNSMHNSNNSSDGSSYTTDGGWRHQS